jgi:cyclopropane fatty-acyl-phospholipid synthase-like methyltransferase
MVAAHWARLPVSYEGAFESLRSKGIEPDDVTAEDLHWVDMLHMGGIAATGSLSKMAGISPGQNVLDEGSSMVGPARRIASKFGALIWGVELSEPLYQTAGQFTILTGLQDQVSFKQGRALALPFKDGKFDVVTMA